MVTDNEVLACVETSAWNPAIIPSWDLRKSSHESAGGLIDIGPWKLMTCAQSADELFADPDFPELLTEDSVQWVRVDLLRPGQDIDLFACQDSERRMISHPDDVVAGTNTWLHPAFAHLAERDVIASCFPDGPKLLGDGSCRVKLWDPKTRKPFTVVVDTFIPCRNGTEMFARLPRAHGQGELKRRACWPLLLEKAFAKHLGGYEKCTKGLISTIYQLCGLQNQRIWFQQQADQDAAIGRAHWLCAKLPDKLTSSNGVMKTPCTAGYVLAADFFEQMKLGHWNERSLITAREKNSSHMVSVSLVVDDSMHPRGACN